MSDLQSQMFEVITELSSNVGAMSEKIDHAHEVAQKNSEQLTELTGQFQALDQRIGAVPEDERMENHAYVSDLREAQAKKKEFWDNLVQKSATAGIIKSLILLATAFGGALFAKLQGWWGG